MKKRDFMIEAIDEMVKSPFEHQKIGAVLVKNDEIIGRGHKTDQFHAERMAITKAKENGYSIKNSTLYTTLEPCVYVGKGQIKSCSELIIEEKIHQVVIGSYDPNSKVNRKGWKTLRDAGVKLLDFDKDLHEEIIRKNEKGIVVFKEGFGPSNGARFDYELNGGKFIIKETKESINHIVTRWIKKGINQIFAYAVHGVRVAKANYAESFDDIDEIHQFDFKSQSVAINVGEICIFKNDVMAVIVKVMEVKSGSRYGADETAVKIQWQTIKNNVS
jgi:diaminohydroxyphosphoribosylaminopyrimidine deaminase / 5-amino-6-(5-phosphoribosylamino)uracil reductase